MTQRIFIALFAVVLSVNVYLAVNNLRQKWLNPVETEDFEKLVEEHYPGIISESSEKTKQKTIQKTAEKYKNVEISTESSASLRIPTDPAANPISELNSKLTSKPTSEPTSKPPSKPTPEPIQNPATQPPTCPPYPKTPPYDATTRPKYNLDRTKFLFPTLIWGPNNQLEGLRETIALCIKLNRTLILPKLYRHYIDPVAHDGVGYQEAIDPAFRLSITSLRKLLPVVYISELSKICGKNSPFAIFPAREMDESDAIARQLIRNIYYFDVYQCEGWSLSDYEKIKNVEQPVKYGNNYIENCVKNDEPNEKCVKKRDYGMIYKDENGDFTEDRNKDQRYFDNNYIPKNQVMKTLMPLYKNWSLKGKLYPTVGPGRPTWIDEQWESYEKSGETCAVRHLPMLTLGLWGGKDVNGEDANWVKNFIAYHTTSPEYVDSLISDFRGSVESLLKNVNVVNDVEIVFLPLSLGVHWRFDKDDWMQVQIHNNREDKLLGEYDFHGLKLTGKMMPLIRSIFDDPSKLGVGILEYAKWVLNDILKNQELIELLLPKIKNPKSRKVVLDLDVYIATPLSETKFIKNVKQNLLKKLENYPEIGKINLLTSADLEVWKENSNFEKNCKWIFDNWYEISGIIEQKICQDPDIFIHTQKVSTWSGVAMSRRNSQVWHNDITNANLRAEDKDANPKYLLYKYDKYVLELPDFFNVSDSGSYVLNPVNYKSCEVGFGDHFPPTAIHSFMGAGNTWLRFLIEKSTGFHTGSCYRDGDLYEGGFKGEFEFTDTGDFSKLIGVKSHNSDWLDSEKDLFRLIQDSAEHKKPSKCVILIRNPFHAFIAEFKRKISGGSHTGSEIADPAEFKAIFQKDNEALAWIHKNKWLETYQKSISKCWSSVDEFKPLLVIYERVKDDSFGEMVKVAKYLNEYSEKRFAECLGESDEGNFHRKDKSIVYEPFTNEQVDLIREQVNRLNETVGGILPESYMNN